MGREEKRPIRALAADDSAVMRSVLKTLFELHASQGDPALPRMELCGVVRDGVEALEAVKTLTPDLLLLDLEMPRMDGLEVLAKLRVQAPALPVIVCSAHTERGARSTLDALSRGAKDCVLKPDPQKYPGGALDSLREQLLPKIAALAGWGLVRTEPRQRPCEPAPERRFAVRCGAGKPRTQAELVVIGVSTGGPSALETMLPKLPEGFAVPVLIVQHLPKLFTGELAERLNRICAMPVQQARDGATISPGQIWLAPGDSHMEVVPGAGWNRGPALRLHHGPALNGCMPSVDYLFRSAAAMYGPATLALLMTGMGSDGLEGARAVHGAGGTVLAQDEATSAVWGMPGRVVKAGIADRVVALTGLAGALMERVNEGRTVQLAPLEGTREVMYGLL